MGNRAGIVLPLYKTLSHPRCYLISEKLLRRDKVTISDLPKVSGLGIPDLASDWQV